MCKPNAERLRFACLVLASLWLCSALGCSHDRYGWHDGLDQRVIPPLAIDTVARTPAAATGVAVARFGPPAGATGAEPASGTTPVAETPSEAIADPRRVLSLAEAIDTAFRQQPRLRVYLESVEQARRAEDIAFAPFLPVAAAGYSAGGFDLERRRPQPLRRVRSPASPFYRAWERCRSGWTSTPATSWRT